MARSPEVLRELFASKTVVDLADIRKALGGVSSMTAFRHLQQVPYRRSYNYNGRYYALRDATQYDRFGLWSCRDIHFSIDGSLRGTVRRLVHDAATGATHRELQDRLRVRVHNTLLDLLRKGEVERGRLMNVFVYFHTDANVGEAQRHRRQEQTRARGAGATEVGDEVIIQILLTLIHHPGSMAADVVRHLYGHAPPVTTEQVSAVFTRYDLGEKGGVSTS